MMKSKKGHKLDERAFSTVELTFSLAWNRCNVSQFKFPLIACLLFTMLSLGITSCVNNHNGKYEKTLQAYESYVDSLEGVEGWFTLDQKGEVLEAGERFNQSLDELERKGADPTHEQRLRVLKATTAIGEGARRGKINR